jgi:hypothetical protein
VLEDLGALVPPGMYDPIDIARHIDRMGDGGMSSGRIAEAREILRLLLLHYEEGAAQDG